MRFIPWPIISLLLRIRCAGLFHNMAKADMGYPYGYDAWYCTRCTSGYWYDPEFAEDGAWGRLAWLLGGWNGPLSRFRRRFYWIWER